jgi:hypothetical protein
VTQKVTLLAAGTLGFWLLVAYPARLVWGDAAVLFSAVAGLLCLVPAIASLVWAHGALKGKPVQQLAAVMGGMGLRMAVVLGAGMAFYFLVPDFHHAAFWLWVVVFYLVTLALEVGLVVTRHSATEQTQNTEVKV